MRIIVALLAMLIAPALVAQTYTVSQVTNEFQYYNIASIGSGLTNSLVQPGTQTVDTDEGVAGPVPIYFDFPFFGNTYDECYVSANGFLSFDALASAHPTPPATVGDAAAPNNLIAPLWKNLGSTPLPGNSSVLMYYTDITGGAGNWNFRVQWSDWPDTQGAQVNTVVVCLFQATGAIEVHFGPLSPTYNFCCGIEDATGSTGFAGPAGWLVTAGPTMAYRFEPVSVQPAQLQIDTTDPLPDGTEGTAYSLQFQASGGVPAYSWFDASTTTTGQPLPTGWTLDTNGLLTAAAQDVVAGTYTFDITVSDTTAAGLATEQFTVTINPVAQALQITTANPLPDGTEGVAYAVQFQATGGTPGYTWSYPVTAPLPAGWNLDANGSLTAAAQDVEAGTHTFGINAMDAAAAVVTESFTVTINPASSGGGTPPSGSSGGEASGCTTTGPSLTPWILALLGAALLQRRKRQA